ncbi:hypothetical protein POKO110462_22790 [Pontibacter korlensis]|uniref:Lipocalin-like domain-containing protein n=1 Tax=Pontibacter korlensis TaxID=400092 RepID=A0A0E3UY92_9BACT|nr:hypothetical protein [Pontibacter korlensis]AKD04937.1 hypothetical protein PKOR_19885 [Pontibacter korlensis]
MKKLFHLPLLLTLLLSACDKEDTKPADTAAELIKGKWTCTTLTKKYYDEQKNLIHQVTVDMGWYYDFDGRYRKIIIPSDERVKPATFDEVFVDEYVVVEVDEKDYFYQVHEGVKYTPVEIIGISDSRMTWIQHDWIPIFNDGTGEVTADSAAQVIKFVRRK